MILPRFLVGVLGFATVPFLSADVTVTRKPSPNRGGPTDSYCPPNGNYLTGAKAALDADKGDINNGNDKRYFMGEVKLVEGDGDTAKDLIVRTWCVSKDPTDRGADVPIRYLFNDFFTFEILTSVGAKETVQVPPGTPC